MKRRNTTNKKIVINFNKMSLDTPKINLNFENFNDSITSDDFSCMETNTETSNDFFISDASLIYNDVQSGWKLFLGSITNANDKKFIENEKIKYVVNTAFENKLINNDITIKVNNFNLKDHIDEKIDNYFDDMFNIINYCRLQNVNILICCKKGISRSATIIIAYLMKYNNMNFNDAYLYVKRKRNIIEPNLGFILKLEQFEKKCTYTNKIT